MKKYWLVGAVLCGLLTFSFLTPSASACIGADGKPVEGTDGEATNCVSAESEIPNPDSWSVNPSTLDFGMLSEVGRSYTASFTIKNSTERDMAYTVSAIKYDGDVADENKLASSWLAFVGGVTYYQVPTLSDKTVNVRVIVPADAKPGSQYAQIKVVDGEEKFQLIEVRMMIGGKDAKFGGKLSTSFISPLGVSDQVSAKAIVKNEGNAGFQATYKLRGKNAFGGMEWKQLVEETAEVAPGKEVEFSNSGEALGFGVYNVEQEISYVNENGEMVSAVNSRTVINLPIWLIIVAGVVIVAIIVLIVFLAIRGKKKEEEEEEEEAKEAAKARKSKKNTKVDIEIDEKDK